MITYIGILNTYMMPRVSTKCVVLVTGGAGFLGQHIIGLLQSRAHHVTEIRVLDMVEYVNKLDYPDSKSVRQFTGSVIDTDLVHSACTGVDAVFHIASVIDTSLLPDEQRSYDINVTGTQTLLDACRWCGVKRLFYCSSPQVVIGRNMGDVHYQGEETSEYPDVFLHGVYGKTKAQAERLVLSANDSSLSTISIRPASMYGEQDQTYVGRMLKQAKSNGWFFRPDCKDAIWQHAYVGNIAWCFVCAENVFTDEQNASKPIGGQAFFVGDDTPDQRQADFVGSLFTPVDIPTFPVDVPCWFMKIILFILLLVLTPLSFFCRVNIPFGFAPIRFLTRTFLFSDKKARSLLGYEPLYTYEEARVRTLSFLRELVRSCEQKGD